MAKYESIQVTDETIKSVQTGLRDLDCLTQNAQETIQTATRSIALWLTQPDSADRRQHILNLCELIEYHAMDVMNCVNATAEKYGANFRDVEREAQSDRMRAASIGASA